MFFNLRYLFVFFIILARVVLLLFNCENPERGPITTPWKPLRCFMGLFVRENG